MTLNAVKWHRKARETVRGFPKEVKRELGRLILQLEEGQSLGMPMSRPMPSVASGTSELRVRGEDGIYRTFYYTRVKGLVIIFHAFKKKTQKTPPLEIELGRKRLKEILDD